MFELSSAPNPNKFIYTTIKLTYIEHRNCFVLNVTSLWLADNIFAENLSRGTTKMGLIIRYNTDFVITVIIITEFGCRERITIFFRHNRDHYDCVSPCETYNNE